MYKVILIIVSVFLLSCNLSKSNNSLDEYTEVISNELKSIYADSFDLSVKSKNDTLFIEVSDLPDYRTGKDYNILLSKYLINCFYEQDRKSTRLNSSHVRISYAVFCLKKKKILLTIILFYII